MKFGDYPKAGSLDGVTGFRNYVQSLGIDMPCDDIVAHGPTSPLAAPIEIDGMKIGHRLAIHPMEGWDCERDGKPSENTKRRWRRFGLSGAKLIWGGEACAVRPDGRANPKQLIMTDESQSDIAALRDTLIAAHKEATGNDDDLVIGLQLTHSGRFCKPNDNTKFESIIAYNHPLLDRKFGYPPDRPPISDDEIKRLIDDYIVAAQARRGLRVRFRRRQALPRLSRPRIPERRRPARPLRRQPGKPHAFHARNYRGHSRRSAAAEDRCPAFRVRFRAVQARPGAFGAGSARPRRAGKPQHALSLRVRRQCGQSARIST